jgi:hypothetical protein
MYSVSVKGSEKNRYNPKLIKISFIKPNIKFYVNNLSSQPLALPQKGSAGSKNKGGQNGKAEGQQNNMLRHKEPSHLGTTPIKLIAIGLANNQIINKKQRHQEKDSPDLGIDYNGIQLRQKNTMDGPGVKLPLLP